MKCEICGKKIEYIDTIRFAGSPHTEHCIFCLCDECQNGAIEVMKRYIDSEREWHIDE